MADEEEQHPVEPWPMATVDDLKARWKGFPVGDEEYAKVKLEDASRYILDEVPEAVDAHPDTRRRIVCDVVRRSMQAEANSDAGVESRSDTTGPFQTTIKPSNPNGDFYLTGGEKRSLGRGKQQAFTADLIGDRTVPGWFDVPLS